MLNLFKLRWQYDWRGVQLYNERILVCEYCEDTPQRQLGTVFIPPDPPPLMNARVEQYNIDEEPVSVRITTNGIVRGVRYFPHWVSRIVTVPGNPANPIGLVSGGTANTLAIDGTAVVAGNGVFGPGGTVFSMPSGFTNAKANSIIIAVFASEGAASSQPTVANVSDNSGQPLTWHKLASVGWTDPGASNTPFDLAVWWTIAPSPFNNVTVTFTTAASIVDDAAALVYAVSGVNASSPFDGNSSLPATTSATTGVNPTPIISGMSSNSATGMLIAFGASTRNTNHSGWDTAGGGFTEITHSENHQDVLSVALGSEFRNFSSAQHGAVATFDNSAFTFAGTAYGMIAAVLVPGFS